MTDSSNEVRYPCSWVHFRCLGANYTGRGAFTWNPLIGFHIEAPVTRLGPPLRGTIEFGAPIVPTEYGTIRVGLGKHWFAVSPRLHLGARMDVALESHLSVDVRRMILIHRANATQESRERWVGTATFVCADSVWLPEELRRETYVAGERIETVFRPGALAFKDDDQRIRLWSPADRTLKLEWSFSARTWPFSYTWTFAHAAIAAASILTGQSMTLLERTGRRRDREYHERCRREEPSVLGLLAPFGVVSSLQTDQFVRLAHFLNREGPEAVVCRAMFEQLAEASRQKTSQARELLTGTILEAALRTLEEQPLGKSKSWSVEEALKRFRVNYWGREWKQHTKRAQAAFDRLRHRNAHPDWLAGSGADRTAARVIEALDDVQLLVRFYGYMMLTLAGIPFKPAFVRLDTQPSVPI